MASTYIASAVSSTFASNRHMITVFNPTGSGKILRVYRVWVENNQIAAVTGVNPVLKLFRCTAASAGYPITPISFDTTNTALGTVTAGMGMTVTTSSLFRNYVVSNDEPSPLTASCDEWQSFKPLCEIWNSGTRNSNIDPILCRETQGITVQNVTATTVGSMDFFIEFTVT